MKDYIEKEYGHLTKTEIVLMMESICNEELPYINDEDYSGSEKAIEQENLVFFLSLYGLEYNFEDDEDLMSYVLKATDEERLNYLLKYTIPSLKIMFISEDVINEAIEEVGLNEGMKVIQDAIGQNDGGICSVYWSHYDNAYKTWSFKEDRKKHITKYLELEKSYIKLYI